MTKFIQDSTASISEWSGYRTIWTEPKSTFSGQLHLFVTEIFCLNAIKCQNWVQKKLWMFRYPISDILSDLFYRYIHIQHYSKLRKNVRVTQSQNVPSSSLSQPVADRQAEAGWRDKLGLGYARAFSAALNTADRGYDDLFISLGGKGSGSIFNRWNIVFSIL